MFPIVTSLVNSPSNYSSRRLDICYLVIEVMLIDLSLSWQWMPRLWYSRMIHNLWIDTNISEEPVVSIFWVEELFCDEEEDIRRCQNAGTHLTNCMIIHLRDCNLGISWFPCYKLNFTNHYCFILMACAHAPAGQVSQCLVHCPWVKVWPSVCGTRRFKIHFWMLNFKKRMHLKQLIWCWPWFWC